MFHNCEAVAAMGKELNPTILQKTLGINDFYSASDGRQWPPPRWSLDDAAEHPVTPTPVRVVVQPNPLPAFEPPSPLGGPTLAVAS